MGGRVRVISAFTPSALFPTASAVGQCLPGSVPQSYLERCKNSPPLVAFSSGLVVYGADFYCLAVAPTAAVAWYPWLSTPVVAWWAATRLSRPDA